MNAQPPKLLPVTRGTVSNATQALQSLACLPVSNVCQQPTWLASVYPDRQASHLLPTPNALVDLNNGDCVPPTPAYFASHCAGCEYLSDAEQPTEWLSFLSGVWRDDQASIDALQEWFGYCLTADTSQQTALALIGPKRSGKGTIARMLAAIVGERSVVYPTLGSLSANFGLQPLIGKTLAIIGDVRLGGRQDLQMIVEQLLSITGEDGRTIDRKHKESWSGKLSTRFVLISNEIPQLHDSAGAIVSRFVFLTTHQSHFGNEDRGLAARIRTELPGVLNWAIAGYRRLAERGRFIQPESAQAIVDEMNDLASPVSQFVRERCELGATHRCVKSHLFDEWKAWAQSVAMPDKEIGSHARFGRALLAACPCVRQTNPLRDGDARVRYYVGIGIRQGTF